MMAWDTVQRKMMCCGIDGPRNWFDINNGSAQGIPASCCRPQYIDRDTQNCLNAAPLYMDRLYQVIDSILLFCYAIMKSNFNLLGWLCQQSPRSGCFQCDNHDRCWDRNRIHSTHGHCFSLLVGVNN